jgi:glycosyltransferase involved in cell wall biosynthesis
MRIGMMTDVYKPHISGITNCIALNKRYLEQVGHEVFVFTFGDLEHEDDEPNIIRSPGLPLVDTGYYLSFRYSLQAKRLLQTMDMVHVHHPFLSGYLALRYCHPLHIPIVFTNHTRYDLYAQAYLPLLPEGISETLLETYMPSFCDGVDLVISPSLGMADVLRQLKVTSHIEIVPNGVELQRFHKAGEPTQRTMFGFKPENILFVYTGRLGLEKNLDFLIKAFAGVADAIENIHLIIIGSGPVEEALKHQAADTSASNRIHFFGMLDYDQLPAYLSMCDAFATASVTEVHPLSVIEAMATSLPVLGIQSVGVGDTVEDGITGFLTGENQAAFAAKMTRLCMDHDLRHKMGEAARKASKQYAIERTTQIMLEHYKHLVFQTAPRKRGLFAHLRSLVEKYRG